MKATAIDIDVPKKFTLPVLSDSGFLRYVNFIILYLGQGIPEGVLFFGVPAWMAVNGKTPGEIGTFVAVLGLPWSFKILIAPMMDRFTYLPMGRRRPWVLVGQLGLILSFLSLAFIPSPLQNMSLLMLAGFCVSFFGALQDVATDGMAVDIVPPDQQARANSLMWGSKIIGISLSLAVGSWLLNKYGFSTAVIAISMFTCIIMLAPLLLRERKGERLLPWTAGKTSDTAKKMQLKSWRVILNSLMKVFKLRTSILLSAMAFVMMIACNYMDTILTVFTVQGLGWTDKAYADYYSTASFAGGIGGMIVGALLIDKFGKKSILQVCFLLFIVWALGLVMLKEYWTDRSFIFAFMIGHRTLYVLASICLFASAMECCWKKISATQFTLYMTIGNLGRITGAWLVGVAKANFDWQIALSLFTLFIVLAWIVLQFIHVKEQVEKVARIEQADHFPLPPQNYFSIN